MNSAMNNAINRPPIKLADLLQGLLASGEGEALLPDMTVSGLSLDSRHLGAGDVFIAVAGTHAHGLDFLDTALTKKPSLVIYEPTETYHDLQDKPDSAIPMIAVPNLQQQVSLIASRFYAHPSRELSVIAITGTNGKTTCAYLLTQLLTAVGVDAAMIGTIGSGRLHDLQTARLTTPDAISLQARLAEFKASGVTHVVMEASSHALHQHRLDAVAVDVAAFTNLSQDHLDYHTDMGEYLATKARLFAFDSVSHAVVNVDEPDSKALIACLSDKVKHINYAIGNKAVDLCAYAITGDALSTNFTLHTNNTDLDIHTALIGQFNVSNLLLVIGVMQALGYQFENLVQAIKTLEAPKGRMQRLGCKNSPTVVIDYAHTPDALEKALSTLKPLVAKDLAAVFGCGGDRDRAKRAVMGAIAEQLADRIYLTDDNPRTEASEQILADIQTGITGSKKPRIISDRATAIQQSIKEAGAQDIVLIAGKGHEDYQIIGTRKIPFSDHAQAQAALARWQEVRA